MKIDDEKWREFAASLTRAQAARGGPDADELTADELRQAIERGETILLRRIGTTD